MITDPIADMLVRLTNASRVKKDTAPIPYSRFKEQILDVLAEKGFIGEVLRRGRRTKRRLEATLLYEDGEAVIRGCRRISKPGRRLFLGVKDIHAPKNGAGLLIISTPAGVLTHSEARIKKMGGEALFEIW
jgi:small subunit ribosomal protein S8